MTKKVQIPAISYIYTILLNRKHKTTDHKPNRSLSFVCVSLKLTSILSISFLTSSYRSLLSRDKFTKSSEMYVEIRNHNKYLQHRNPRSTLLEFSKNSNPKTITVEILRSSIITKGVGFIGLQYVCHCFIALFYTVVIFAYLPNCFVIKSP